MNDSLITLNKLEDLNTDLANLLFVKRHFSEDRLKTGISLVELLIACEQEENIDFADWLIKYSSDDDDDDDDDYKALEFEISDPKTFIVKNLYFHVKIIIDCSAELKDINIVARKVHFKKSAVLNENVQIRAEVIEAENLELNKNAVTTATINCIHINLKGLSKHKGDIDAKTVKLSGYASVFGFIDTENLDLDDYSSIRQGGVKTKYLGQHGYSEIETNVRADIAELDDRSTIKGWSVAVNNLHLKTRSSIQAEEILLTTLIIEYGTRLTGKMEVENLYCN